MAEIKKSPGFRGIHFDSLYFPIIVDILLIIGV